MNRILRWPFLVLLVSGAAALGCGDDDGSPDTSVGDSGIDEDGGEDLDSGPIDNGVSGDEIYDDECADPGCVGIEIESACVCLPNPPDAAGVTPNRVGCAQLEAPAGVERNREDDDCDESASDGAPALGCNMAGSYGPPGTSEMVTVYGVVDVFGNGGDADMITVEICREGPNGMPTDCLPSVVASTGDPCAESEIQYENDVPAGDRELGFYVIENVPTETPLIIHTSGDGAFWRDIYTYNIVVPNSEVERDAPAGDACATLAAIGANPRWDYRARILADSDWTSIPLTAGLVEGIRASAGVVAGEVHDCDDIRLEYATVATIPRATVFTYFNDNPDNPLPQTSRTEGTSQLSFFAALDIPAGPVDVAAIGRVNGEVVTLGWYRARVFAGATTSITLRGLRTHQTPDE